MIVTVKNEVNEPEVRLRAPWNEGSRGVHRAAQEDETKYFFQAGNSSIYQRFPFRLRRTSVQDSSRLKFLSTHRSVRLHGSSSLYQQSPNF